MKSMTLGNRNGLGSGFAGHLGAGLLLLAMAIGLAACGGGKGSIPGTYHPTGWLAIHPGQAIADLAHCQTCHSLSVLRVGSSIPNCTTTACHHGTIPGFNLAASHGLRAKALQDSTGGGLVSCQICHGHDFSGGGSGVSCQSCHGVAAPHPPKPWNDTASYTHATTDPANAAVCAQCHLAGSPLNPAGSPTTPPAPGTVPTCFNATMCHGSAAPHPLGTVWRDPTSTAFHGLSAKQNLLACQACHGVPGTPEFDHGATATACSTCHTAAFAHSTTWYPAPVETFPGYVPSHRDAGNQANACPTCHDYTLNRPAPLPAAPSCFSSTANAVACHVNGPGQPNHPVPFLGAVHTGATPASFTADCGNCHGDSGPSPAASAPQCSVCHQAGSPLVQTACTSCHGKPPAGSQFPDVTGAHPKHDALATITGLCAPCHNTYDSGTQAHYDRANARPGKNALRVPPGAVQFLATYNAHAGTGALDTTALTCSNVSCHGGVATPAWGTGSIAVGTDAGCRMCHQLGTALGVPENNSEYSGLHAFHLGSQVNALCTDCHSMSNGTPGANNHFAHLDTPQMEGPASDTILLLGSASNTYDPVAKTCTVTCHSQVHTVFSWSGGPDHPVPFLGSSHTSNNSTTAFNANCANCHALATTASSPLPNAPQCGVCHQAGAPTALSNCASCHEKPPAGSAFPDAAYLHALHDGLNNVTGQCGTCHTGYDSGTQAHYDHANARPGKNALRVAPAPVAFAAIYNAKAGTGAFSPTAYTCSNVSCHGALTAPTWQNGVIDVNGASGDTGCRLCHSQGTALGVPENNSYYSGRHSQHLGNDINAKCTDCHSMTNGTPGALAHFTTLNTPQMEGPASDTIQYGGSRTVYNAAAQTCTLTCHGQNHNGNHW